MIQTKQPRVRPECIVTGDTSPTITASNCSKNANNQPWLLTPLKFMERNQKNIDGDYAFTIDSVNTGGLQNGQSIRRLTPVECMRLQGFPDTWCDYGIDENGNEIKISDTQKYKCAGNAVTVDIVELIARKLLQETT